MLGVVPPGGKLPLPLYWSLDNCDLQIRPAASLPDQAHGFGDGGAAGPSGGAGVSGAAPGHVYSWSQSTVSPQTAQSLGLKTLKEGAAKLLCCRSLAAPSLLAPGGSGASTPSAAHPPPSSSAALSVASSPSTHGTGRPSTASSSSTTSSAPATPPPDFWVSVVCECEQLVSSQASLDVLTDWRLVVRPPLVLHNLLPLGASFRLWQRPVWARAGGGLRPVGAGRVAAGGTAPVHSVDMRQPVYLEFNPDGAEFADRAPVMLSPGALGVGQQGPGAQLPDSFLCRYRRSLATGAAQVRPP